MDDLEKNLNEAQLEINRLRDALPLLGDNFFATRAINIAIDRKNEYIAKLFEDY